MGFELLTISLILGISGLGFLIFTIQLIRGKLKIWWILPSSPIVPGGVVYWGIPASICMLITGFSLLLPTVEMRSMVFMIGICTTIPKMFIFLIWRPRWLTPVWLRWLEENHKDVLPFLEKEAEDMSNKWGGSRNWAQRIDTQEGLEEWVAEVRQKYWLSDNGEWLLVVEHSDMLEPVQQKDIDSVIATNPIVSQEKISKGERVKEARQVDSKFKVGIKILGLLSTILATVWFWKRWRQ